MTNKLHQLHWITEKLHLFGDLEGGRIHFGQQLTLTKCQPCNIVHYQDLSNALIGKCSFLTHLR